MPEEARLPAQLEVSGLLRRVQQEGGFATVLARGEAESGAIIVVLIEGRGSEKAYERMPHPSGGRPWTLTRSTESTEPQAFAEWLERRRLQDPDLWIIELDIPQGERFILMQPSAG